MRRGLLPSDKFRNILAANFCEPCGHDDEGYRLIYTFCDRCHIRTVSIQKRNVSTILNTSRLSKKYLFLGAMTVHMQLEILFVTEALAA